MHIQLSHTDKSQIRLQKLAERHSMNSALMQEWSQVMADTLSQSFEYQQCALVHVFLSTRSEPQTEPIIQRAWKDSKVVVVPRIIESNPLMHHVQYRSEDTLMTGPYGIREVQEGIEVTDEQIRTSNSLIIVPLVAFNERLYRIGYGKGYYDRFLENRTCFAFGLAFSFGFSEHFVEDAHDVGLDAIVTEQGIIRKRRNTSAFTF